MSTQAALGQKALAASDYPTAITHFTSALKDSKSPLWLIQRSTAYQRTSQHDLALIDAEAAVLAAKARGKRELMATAQYRRAIALHGLKRYGDARRCFNWCMKLNEKEKGLTLWMNKVKADWEKAKETEGEEGEMCGITVKEWPEEVEDVMATSQKTKAAPPKPAPAKPIPVTAAAPAPLQPTPKEKIREEWYQSAQTVSISIFAKGVPKDKAEVKIEENSLEVSFPTTSGSTYDYTISPLFAQIIPSESTSRVTPHKIEIILKKASQGLKWSVLNGAEASTTISSSNPEPVLAPKPKVEDKAPAYPTSSRTGPKNWDSIAGKEDDKEGDGVDDFFKVLYKNADDDTKKAMMKSYQESNGTALSTDWGSVKKGTVETKPPEGVEAKKWGE